MAERTGVLLPLPLESLVPSPTNPRKAFDETKLQELAASIARQGLLQPIVVRPMPQGRGLDLFDESYEIVAGERRYRASKLAGKVEAPCIVASMTDEEVVEAQVVENSQRDDVTALEEADAFGSLLEMPTYRAAEDPVGDLAHRLGKSKSWVYGRLKLRALGTEARALMENGAMSASVAVDVARLQPRDQARACKALYSSNAEVTLKDARNWIRGNLLLRVADFPFDTEDALLLPRAGACSTCPKNTAVDPTAFVGEEGGRKGLCTDPACHRAKLHAREEQAVAQAREATRREPRLISTNYRKPARAEILKDSQYRTVSENAPGAVPAVVVEAWSQSSLYKLEWIQVRDTKDSREDAEAKAREGAKVARTFRRSLMGAIGSATAGTSPYDVWLVQAVFRTLWKETPSDVLGVIVEEMGLEPPEPICESGYRDYRKMAEGWAHGIDEGLLAQLMVRLTFARELSVSEYDGKEHYTVPPVMGRIAQSFDVDALDLLDEAMEGVAPRKLANLLDAPEEGEMAVAATLDEPAKEEEPNAGAILAWGKDLALRANMGEEIALDPVTYDLVRLAVRDDLLERNVPNLIETYNRYVDEGIFHIHGRAFRAVEGGASMMLKAVPA